MILTHSQLVTQILALLSLMDVVATVTDASAVKRHGGRYLTHRVVDGWPDITGVLGASYLQPGRAFLIEVKAESQNCESKKRKAQTDYADKLIKAGALVIREARSIEEVKEVLERGRKK